MTEKKGLALHWRIVIGMVAGIAVGILAVYIDSLNRSEVPEGTNLVKSNTEFQVKIDGKAESVKEEQSPQHGTSVTFVGKNELVTVVYTPEKDYQGNDSVVLNIKRPSGTTETHTIKFQVEAESYSFSRLVVDWIKPFGTIFINLLKLIAIPLIVASLIKGISDLNDISNLSALGGRTVVLYLFTTVVSVTLGLCIVNVVKPGNSFSDETKASLTSGFEKDAEEKITAAKDQKSKGPLQALVDVVPDNIFNASTGNGNMLKIIFFVLFFGVALLMIKPEDAQPVKHFFTGLNSVILKMIDLIMLMAPFGVFALLAAQVVATPSLDVLYGLLSYSICVVAGLATLVFVFYPSLVVLFGGRSYTEFFRGISPAQLLAFSTSSSAATLPVTMECVEDNLGVRKEVSSFVLPIGATVNMDGTSLYQAVAAVFIAQALGVELTLSDQMVIVLTATLASIGSAAVPGAGIVMLVIVLGSIGVSEKGIALIFAVDRILDMCRTVVNVTGDATVSLLVNRAREKSSK